MGGGVVLQVIDLEEMLESSSGVPELVQVERLGLVEFVPVRRPQLVSVLVLLSPPGSPVPQLPVALVARDLVVRFEVHLQELGGVEALSGRWGTRSEVGLIEGAGVLVASSHGRVGVLLTGRLHVEGRFQLCTAAKAARVGLQGLVNLSVECQSKPKVTVILDN